LRDRAQARDLLQRPRRRGGEAHVYLAARARLLLFAFMLRNAVRAVDLFRIPTDNFIEMGRLVEI